MSHINRRRKTPKIRANPNVHICQLHKGSWLETLYGATRCHCVETQERAKVIGRRKSKRATARKARRGAKVEA